MTTEIMNELKSTITEEAAEAVVAAEVVAESLRMIRPGLAAIMRYQQRRGKDLVIGGPGRQHMRKPQYACSGSVTGWAYVLMPDATISYRRYGGSYSDFGCYDYPTHSDSPVSIAGFIAGMLDADASQTASQVVEHALREISDAAINASRESRSSAATERIVALQRTLATLQAK